MGINMADDYDHHGEEEPRVDKKYLNETIKLLHERSSVRSYEDKPIPDDILKVVLEAGIHAPTGGNLQPYSIIRITDKEVNQKLGKMCQQEFIGTAPVNLLFCIDWRRLKRWSDLEKAPFTAYNAFRHFWISFQDVIIAAQNICTAADAVGLGSCYIGTVMDLLPDMQKIFELPEGVQAVVLLCLGYPKFRPEPKRKLGVETVVHDNKYRDLSDEELLEAYNKKYPAKRMEITEERLERIRQACETVGGTKLADECLAKIKEQNDINVAQRYFGLHYVADIMPQGNEEFVKAIKDQGFNWFEEFEFNKE